MFNFLQNHSSVTSSPSNGGISSIFFTWQSAPPFCLPIRSGRELWEEWDWATSANTARELSAVFKVLGFSTLVFLLPSSVTSSLLLDSPVDCSLGLLF